MVEKRDTMLIQWELWDGLSSILDRGSIKELGVKFGVGSWGVWGYLGWGLGMVRGEFGGKVCEGGKAGFGCKSLTQKGLYPISVNLRCVLFR